MSSYRSEIPRPSTLGFHVSDITIMGLHAGANIEFLRTIEPSVGFEVLTFAGHHEVDYVRELLPAPDPVVVETRVIRVGTSSFTLASELRDETGALVSMSRSVYVCAAGDRNGSVPIPASLRAGLEAALPEHQS